MPLDAVLLSAVSSELEEALVGMKVEKVRQPGKDELIILFRGAKAPAKLLISTGSGNYRIHLTEDNSENPVNAPAFCMLLRKHLTSARVSAVSQPGLERIIDIELECYDEMGNECRKHLISELMGRNSNVILAGQDGIIIGCLRWVDAEMSEKRQVMPGLFYHLPPTQEKADPLLTDEAGIEALWSGTSWEKTVDKWLLDSFIGLSPLVCREISYNLAGSTDRRIPDMTHEEKEAFPKGLSAFFDRLKNKSFVPTLICEDGRAVDFSYLPVKQYGALRTNEEAESFSALLDGYYTARANLERLRSRSSAMLKSIKNAKERTDRKLAAQRQELLKCADRETLREYGDIIKANLYAMTNGMRVLKATNFYSEDCSEIEIPLDPRLSPQKNAEKYYKEYTKAKNAEKFLASQIEENEKELDYLESVLEEAARAETEKDIEEVRSELVGTGYLKENRKKKKTVYSGPMRFISSEGMEIRVGKNNMQNEKLTLHDSYKTDVWLHTQKIHGAHVVISARGGEVGEKTLEEAAVLAALYSQAAESSKVPVDYTLIKNVKKIPGGRPGMVSYVGYKTVFVSPDRALAEKLTAGGKK